MVEKMPQPQIKTEIVPHSKYPCLALDISCAFGINKPPIKTNVDIKKAVLVQMADRDFLDKIAIQEIEGEDKINNDLLITNKWIIKNESDEEWPPNPDKIILKCLSNDCLIKLQDIDIKENLMNPMIMKPGEISELSIDFVLPHRIRLAATKTKKTLNIIFSLYDKENECYVGSNLPCTIPL